MDISILIPATIAGIVLLGCGCSSLWTFSQEEMVLQIGQAAKIMQITAASMSALGAWLLYAIYMSVSFPS